MNIIYFVIGYIRECVTSLWGERGSLCHNRVLRLAPCVGRSGNISFWGGCWFWILEARRALFSGKYYNAGGGSVAPSESPPVIL